MRFHPPAFLTIGIGAALLAGLTLAVPSPVSAAPSAPTPTLNAAALGSGGGAFCNETRNEIKMTISTNISAAIAGGDTAKVKAYYESLSTESTKLMALAPSQLKAPLAISLKQSSMISDALKKANYDYKKLDPAAFTKLGSPDAATKAAEDKINAYMAGTCHIDIKKAFGVPSSAAKTAGGAKTK